MTEPTSEKILDRVRKLLNKAEDPACTPPEAEALTAKATELIAKYGVDQALLADPGNQDKVTDRKYTFEAPYADVKANLLYRIAEALGCRAIFLTHTQRGTVHVFAWASDLERVNVLYTTLVIQSANAMTHQPVPPGVNTTSFRRAFLRGFALEVSRRLREAERRARAQAAAERPAAEAASNALVLSDRGKAVADAFRAGYPHTRRSSGRFGTGGGGYGAGSAAGRSANLGGTGVGGGRLAIGR